MTTPTPRGLPLDPTLYGLSENESAFFKACTGIQDDDELRKHITEVQAEAYAVHPYQCIRRFAFTTLKISKYPTYGNVLKIGKGRSGAILLDLGCCFGNDARKAIADGFPRENVIASDLHLEYWTLGHKLFKTTQEAFPVVFLSGDIFDASFLSPSASPFPTSTTPSGPVPPLSTLTSLTPLQHRISVIHTSSFFQLFPVLQQRALARLLGALLSPLPGSMIFGSDIGLPDTEENKQGGTRLTVSGTLRLHIPPRAGRIYGWGKAECFSPGMFLFKQRPWKSKGKIFPRREVIRRTRLIFSFGV